MKPIIILPPDSLSPEDIQALKDNGLCVVVAKDPAVIQFVDPIPAVSSRTDMENAAIKLSRRNNITALYVDLLVEGTPLSSKPTKAELERQWFDKAKHDEMQKLAREEARAERAAKKQVK